MELSKNVKIGLGSLAVAMVLSIFAPIVALRSVPTATAASIGVTAPAPQIDYDGSAGLVWQGWVKWTWPQWGFVTITNPHYGQTYQDPTVFGTHRTLVLKWNPKTWDGNAWVRLHISPRTRTIPDVCLSRTRFTLGFMPSFVGRTSGTRKLRSLQSLQSDSVVRMDYQPVGSNCSLLI